MAKIWMLERFITKEENLSYYKEALEIAQSLEGVENREKVVAKIQNQIETAADTWTPVYWNINYFTFCGKVKQILKGADSKAISELKNSLGKVSYSPEVNAQFRETHQSVKNSYRVVCSENFEGDYKNELMAPVVGNKDVNPGVYSYLWGSMVR